MKLKQLRWRFYRKTGGPRSSYYGKRCKDYGPGCPICEAYRYLDQHGRFPSFEEVMAISDAILGNPTQGTTT